MIEEPRIEYRVEPVQGEVYRLATYLVWTDKEQLCAYRPGLSFEVATTLKATYEARRVKHGEVEE